jgi:hypothetical protein
VPVLTLPPGITRAEGEHVRYRLQRKETVVRPNILGNCSQPVYTYRWKDIAACDDRSELEKMMLDNKNYRIEDTRPDN